ncbi:MAG: MFS transporter, partial [Candidatus Lindowbacteria bacterium]|nr:MFS transporter [Candidatus Lindowbacteria bacterium]
MAAYGGVCVTQSVTSNQQVEPSVWSPLRQPVFRALWTANFVSNIGTLMQGIGAAW